MHSFRFYFLVFILFALADSAYGQRFKAGVVFGLNAAQIDGDNTAGFNKAGLHGGLRGVTVLGQKSEISFELLLSQRGSRAGLVAGNLNDPQKISLNYVEVPVIFNYKDWLDEDGWYKLNFSGGLSFGRLLGTKIQDISVDALSPFFNNNDLGILFGATFYINEHFGITARYTRSLTLLYNNNKNTQINAKSLLSYFLTFRGVYMF